MNYEKSLERAVDLYNQGNLDDAITLLKSFLNKKTEEAWFTKYPKATLYLGTLYRFRGDWDEGIGVLLSLSQNLHTNAIDKIHALMQLSLLHISLLQYRDAESLLEQSESGIASLEISETDPQKIRLLQLFHSARASLRDYQGRSREALEHHQESLTLLIQLQPNMDCDRAFIYTYLNLYNCHMILGNKVIATEYIVLAHAKMTALKKPYALGLVQFFDSLASHNLFTAGSQAKAISALSNISEEVVTNFADFRKIFDFFSSIIVQLHEGKVDLEKVRESIREYGNDPLIKAYMPVLLTGAAPPGDHDPDEDTPAAFLTD